MPSHSADIQSQVWIGVIDGADGLVAAVAKDRDGASVSKTEKLLRCLPQKLAAVVLPRKQIFHQL